MVASKSSRGVGGFGSVRRSQGLSALPAAAEESNTFAKTIKQIRKPFAVPLLHIMVAGNVTSKSGVTVEIIPTTSSQHARFASFYIEKEEDHAFSSGDSRDPIQPRLVHTSQTP